MRTLFAPAGTTRAAQREPARGVFQADRDVAREPVAPDRVDRDRDRRPCACIDLRRRDAQLEVGARRADPQPIPELGSALPLDVGQAQQVGAVRRERRHQLRVRVMRQQAGGLVFEVVVERDACAGRANQLERRVERRAEPPRANLGDDRLARLPLEREDVHVARFLDPSVDDHREREALGVLRGRVRLAFERLGQRVDGERHAVGRQLAPGGGHRRHARLRARRIHRHSRGLQVPAGHLDGGLRPGRPAEREDAGDERELADGDPVDEVLAASIERVLDLQHVVAVGRDLHVEHRVGLVAVVVAVGDLVARRVAERERRLDPAGHGVGQIGHQVAGADDADEVLPLAGRETIAIGVARRVLPGLAERELRAIDVARNEAPVDDGRQRDGQFGVGLAGLLFLLHELRHRADDERERVRQAERGVQPNLARSRLRAGVDGNGECHHFGERPGSGCAVPNRRCASGWRQAPGGRPVSWRSSAAPRALSRSSVSSFGVSGLSTPTICAWMPGPETEAAVTVSRNRPPTLTCTVVPRWPPAG